MHQVAVILAGEDVAGAAHIRRELVDLVEAAVHDSAAKALVPQVRARCGDIINVP
jgi:hypothetical protein